MAREKDDRGAANEATARKLADSTRLLHGEDPSSTDPDDVAHWITVYAELVDFKDVALRLAAERRVSGLPEVDRELGEIDVPLLSREREHYLERLAYWQRLTPKL